MEKTKQQGNIGIILVILLLVSLGLYLISNPKNQINSFTEEIKPTNTKPFPSIIATPSASVKDGD